MALETVFLVPVSKEIYGICRGSLIFASLHYNFKTFLIGILEDPKSAQIVFTLGLWASGCLESGRSDSRRLVLWKLDAGLWTLAPKKIKMYFTFKGAVADYDIFNSEF